MGKLVFGKKAMVAGNVRPSAAVQPANKTTEQVATAKPTSKPFGNFAGKKPVKIGTGAGGKPEASDKPATPFKKPVAAVAASFGAMDMSKANQKPDVTKNPDEFDDIIIPGVGANAASLAKYQHPLQPENPSDLQTLEFNDAMEKLAEAVNAKSPAIADNTTYIREMMAATPAFAANLHPSDMGLLVRSLRISYGNVKTKKVTNKKKTSAKAQRVDDILDGMGDLGF